MSADKELSRIVHEAIGEASMCWNPRPSSQVFNSEEAAGVAERLIAGISALRHLEAKDAARGKYLIAQARLIPNGADGPTVVQFPKLHLNNFYPDKGTKTFKSAAEAVDAAIAAEGEG